MKINIENRSALLKIHLKIKKIIVKSIEHIIKSESSRGRAGFKSFIKNISPNDIRVNLLFVDDREIKKYNKKYFNRNSTTDVIAFSMIEGETLQNNPVLGDAVISVQTAKRNSREYGQTLEEELLLYVTHALLHLMGYDHPGKNSPMRRKEKKYLKYIKEKLL